MRYFLAGAFLIASVAAYSANPTAPAAPGKARIVVKSEPLRGNTAELTINGKKVAAIGVDDPYSGVFDPGKVILTVPGESIDIQAEGNKEYIFEISLVP